MRPLIVIAGVLVMTLPAFASDVDPKTAVLRSADVPAGYRLDSRQTSVFSNKSFSPQYAARLGRVSGYVATYHGPDREVMRSRVDVFRRPVGARLLLRDLDDAYRSRGRRKAGVGAEGWVYSSGVWSMVLWRHGRLVGLIDSWGLGKVQALAFARLQQQRMARASR